MTKQRILTIRSNEAVAGRILPGRDRVRIRHITALGPGERPAQMGTTSSTDNGNGGRPEAHRDWPGEPAALHVTFRVHGLARFLSHAETLGVLQRACTRAGIAVQYTQGFNPHPRMSLPVPRPVGVESDGDLLCVRLDTSCGAASDPVELAGRLGGELPEGIDVMSACLARAKDSIQASRVRYVFPIGESETRGALRERIGELMAQTRIEVRRRSDKGRAERTIDIRPFVKLLELRAEGVVVDCAFSQAGSARVDELLGLLDLGPGKLSAPVRRTHITWNRESRLG